MRHLNLEQKLVLFGSGFMLLVVISLALITPVVSAYFEANAYNRVTGSNVSTWDAMFLDLRVQEQPKQ